MGVAIKKLKVGSNTVVVFVVSFSIAFDFNSQMACFGAAAAAIGSVGLWHIFTARGPNTEWCPIMGGASFPREIIYEDEAQRAAFRSIRSEVRGTSLRSLNIRGKVSGNKQCRDSFCEAKVWNSLYHSDGLDVKLMNTREGKTRLEWPDGSLEWKASVLSVQDIERWQKATKECVEKRGPHGFRWHKLPHAIT